jgi:glycosyltransferase involved in cell wall biosynthesis
MAYEQPGNGYTEPLLSIVVTAHNVDGYIEEALNSVLGQPDIDAIRIIVVDDGSTDSTVAAALLLQRLEVTG